MKKRGLGLFSWQNDNQDNALTYTAGIIVGVIFLLIGSALVASEVYQVGNKHLTDWGVIISGITCLLVGVFLAHAGVIYWWRRIFPKGNRGLYSR